MIEPPPIQQRVRDKGLTPTWLQSGIIIASAAVAAAIHIVVEEARGNQEYAISRAMGALLCSIIGAGIVAGIVYAATRRRSLWPTAICASVLLLGLSVGSSVGFAGRAREAALWRDLDAVNVRTLEDLRSVADSPTAAADLKAIMLRHNAELDRLGKGLTGNDAIGLKVGVEFTRDMTTIMAEYLTSLQPFKKAGGLSPETMKDKAGVTKRRQLLTLPVAMHGTILASIRLIPQDLRGRFIKNGATDRDAPRLEQAMLSGMHFARLLKAQELEGQLLAAMDEHLGALESSSSKWTIKGGVVEFRDQKALDGFNERVHHLQALVAEQERVQGELRAGRQRPGAGD